MLKKGKFKRGLVECIAICSLLAFLSLGVFILQGHGAFTVVSDFNTQQIPFTIGLHNSLLDGGFDGWSWNADLGSSTLQTYSFYEMGSIFFYLSMLFPAKAFPYLIGWIYMLKYVAAGVSAYLYISLFTKRDRFAVIGAVLYAFSGFQTTNLMFYHFHDAVAFFPLMLYGLERLMEDRRDCGVFIFAVFLNAVTNYFFFVQGAVFLILYFLLRFWTWNLPQLMGKAAICIGCGVLGLGLSAFILLPSLLYLMGNSRFSYDLFYIDALVWETRRFLHVVKGMILPGEPMGNLNSVYREEWSSTSCYLPLVGMSFVIAYLRRNRDWLSRMLIVLIVISLSPLLSSIFLLGRAGYQRWWYILVLIMALCCALVAEDRERYDLRYGALSNAVAVVVFCCMLLFMRSYEEPQGLVFHRVRFLAYAALALSGLAYVYLYGKGFTGKIPYYRYLLAGVSVMAVLTTSSTLYFYREYDGNANTTAHLHRYEMGEQIALPDQQYRLQSDNNELIYTGQAIGTGSYTSTVSHSIVDFDRLFDYYSNIVRMDKGTIPGLNELLGAKYYLSNDSQSGKLVQTLSARGKELYVMEGSACPIGFAADSYILQEELMSLAVDQRAIAMLDSMVVDQQGEALVSQYLPHKTPDALGLDQSPEEYVAENTARAVKQFERDGHGFRCQTAYDEDSVVWFSVPYEGGWTAAVDGNEAEIIYSGGMMAIAVPAGTHTVDFAYSTPGCRTGALISLGSFAACALLYVIIKRKQKILLPAEKEE